MKPQSLLLTILLAGSAAHAAEESKPVPVNRSNLNCEITRHQNVGGAVYLGHAVYRSDTQDIYRVFLEGSDSGPAPVEQACRVVYELLDQAEANNGLVDAIESERYAESRCYLETTGGVYAPRPTGNSYRILRKTNSIKFSSELSVHKVEYSMKRYIGSSNCLKE